MTQGMKMAGIKVIAGIDIDEGCKKTYEANHPEAKFILRDIKKFPRPLLQKTCGVKRNDDSLIFIGCCPCQYLERVAFRQTIIRSHEGITSRVLALCQLL